MGELEKGVYIAQKKNGEIYYRASFTYKNKHISLGSFEDEKSAHRAYECANSLVQSDAGIDDYIDGFPISFEKYVVIVNFRDNNIYLSNPIYVRKRYFSYYLSQYEEMKFSIDDLFFFMSHKILRRGAHLYVNDYGMQFSLRQRYGIKNYAVENKDFRFFNDDPLDYRYENIEVVNKYQGVDNCIHRGKNAFKARIHVNGDIVIGYYDDAIKAAIAYNKAVDILKKNGSTRNYAVNYIDNISGKIYADIYSGIEINDNIYNALDK